MERTYTLDRERETPRTWRYKNDVLGTIYIPKAVLDGEAPEQLQITISTGEMKLLKTMP